MTVAVVVATFGDYDEWNPLAERAVASVEAQTRQAKEIVRVHGKTLHGARNRGAAAATADWLIFLDADDTLDARYIEAMMNGRGGLRQPSTLGVYEDGHEDDEPVLIKPRGATLWDGNHLVIGTMVERERVLKVGGFRDWAAWEDWDLWLRCWRDGAEITAVPEAIYRVSVKQGRNSVSQEMGRSLFAAIRSAQT